MQRLRFRFRVQKCPFRSRKLSHKAEQQIFMVLALRGHVPLKQGLRLNAVIDHALYSSSVRDHIPLKQGLRRLQEASYFSLTPVRDHIPLKQGLRRLPVDEISNLHLPRPYSIKTRIKTKKLNYTIRSIPVRDHIPLKQGLRPFRDAQP